DQGKRDGGEALLGDNRHRIPHGLANGVFGSSPEHVDARDMDDAAKGQLPGGGKRGLSERKRAVPGKFTERLGSSLPLDGSRNPLRQQQPPGNNVAVPGVDNDLDRLGQQIAFDDFGLHCDPSLGTCRSYDPLSGNSLRKGREKPGSTSSPDSSSSTPSSRGALPGR